MAGQHIGPTPAPTTCLEGSGCCDIDYGGVADQYSDACAEYTIRYLEVGPEYFDWCGRYDDADFTSEEMCCVCGGGTTSEPPTMSPTASLVPTGTFAPTRSPLEATNYDELDAFSQLDGAVIEVTQDIHWPVNYDDFTSYRISIEHRSVWIWSSVNAALDGGRSAGTATDLSFFMWKWWSPDPVGSDDQKRLLK